ncbi:MAG: hypothetical protein HKN70_03420 [Gammaproteobacteria bacterium]|nr:hypothetical protein [Gammaproteobacteria bacterium]
MIMHGLRHVAYRIDSMSLRERVLVFASALFALTLVWFEFAMAPALDKGQATIKSIESARERIQRVDATIRAQANALQLDISSPLSAQLDQARQRAREVDALISAREMEILDPATMAQVLEDMLANQRGLRLLRARNLDAERLLESDNDAPLYRHTLRLELEGPYLAVLDYLEELEALPWRIYWQGIEIDAKDYPRNRVRIEISTLSFVEDWIGV